MIKFLRMDTGPTGLWGLNLPVSPAIHESYFPPGLPDSLHASRSFLRAFTLEGPVDHGPPQSLNKQNTQWGGGACSTQGEAWGQTLLGLRVLDHACFLLHHLVPKPARPATQRLTGGQSFLLFCWGSPHLPRGWLRPPGHLALWSLFCPLHTPYGTAQLRRRAR